MKVDNEKAESDEPKETKKRKMKDPEDDQTGTTDNLGGRKGNGTFGEFDRLFMETRHSICARTEEL